MPVTISIEGAISRGYCHKSQGTERGPKARVNRTYRGSVIYRRFKGEFDVLAREVACKHLIQPNRGPLKSPD